MYQPNYYYKIDSNSIREIQRQQYHNNQMIKSIECINKFDELKRSLNDLDEE